MIRVECGIGEKEERTHGFEEREKVRDVDNGDHRPEGRILASLRRCRYHWSLLALLARRCRAAARVVIEVRHEDPLGRRVDTVDCRVLVRVYLFG